MNTEGPHVDVDEVEEESAHADDRTDTVEMGAIARLVETTSNLAAPVCDIVVIGAG